ncbi:hypothetical protein M9H77_03393 [Catharanthus roseus]|uniref:Uncharacterized protein n=1 Tax=Catharanthus roseus TaxID=4058 RepID=A0ACC0CBA8_CATRO|nr:hypothetical protein M9H77_03393 [Catharanthus roseus]
MVRGRVMAREEKRHLLPTIGWNQLEDKRWLIPRLQKQGLIANRMKIMVGMLTEKATIEIDISTIGVKWVSKVRRQNMEIEGKMDYYSYDIINFPPPPSDSCFGHFCKETKSFSFVLDFDRNSLQYVCSITSMSGRRHTIEFECQGESIREILFLCYGDSSMSFSSNLFLFYVFFFKEWKLFLIGDIFLELDLECSTLYSLILYVVMRKPSCLLVNSWEKVSTL